MCGDNLFLRCRDVPEEVTSPCVLKGDLGGREARTCNFRTLNDALDDGQLRCCQSGGEVDQEALRDHLRRHAVPTLQQDVLP